MQKQYGTRGDHGTVATLASFSTPRTISEKFFGQHIHGYPGTISRPSLSYSTVRNLDYSLASRRIAWWDIETSKGVFYWTALDAWVAQNETDGVDMVFTFCFSPPWAVAAAATGDAAYSTKGNQPPDNNSDWIDWITAVVARYGVRIKYYQGWNEPNLPQYYGGAAATSARLAELQRILYQTVKAIQPTAVILSPCFTSVFTGIDGLVAYLAASDADGGTGKSWFDVVSYNFYCNNDSRRIHGLWQMWQGVQTAMVDAGISKPVWTTETGLITPSLKTYSEADKAVLVSAYMLSLAVLGVDRVIYYGYDDGIIGFDDSAEAVAAWNLLASQISGRTFSSGSIKFSGNRTYTVTMGDVSHTVTDVP